jgi:hypothetical protein
MKEGDGGTLGVLGENIVVAALAWWEGRCPHTWTLEEHLAKPLVNSASPRETELARSVAAYLHAKQRKDRRRGEET